jgi:hypothetical protein
MNGKTVKKSQGEIVGQQMVKNATVKGKQAPHMTPLFKFSSWRTRRARPRARR